MIVSCAPLWLTGLLFVAQWPITQSIHSRRHRQEAHLKEFPLTKLLNVAVRSNDANRFIRMNTVKGKPLEVQYESTRELDMDLIESDLLTK